LQLNHKWVRPTFNEGKTGIMTSQRKKTLLFAALFGAWVGGVYSVVSQVINRLFLPAIPLAPPEGGIALYVLEYILFGMVLGLVSAYPTYQFLGIGLGGALTAFLIFISGLSKAWGQDTIGSTMLLLSCSFMPLIVLMMPIAYLVRLGVDAQERDPSRPYLWARSYIIPALLTVVVIILGSLSLYPKDHRRAISYVQEMIQTGRQAGNLAGLAAPLKDVDGYIENGYGPYTVSLNENIESFFGPRPIGSEMSQFLVITRFENGFSFACIFSENRKIPNCAKY
jgi:hypothetical protein